MVCLACSSSTKCSRSRKNWFLFSYHHVKISSGFNFFRLGDKEIWQNFSGEHNKLQDTGLKCVHFGLVFSLKIALFWAICKMLNWNNGHFVYFLRPLWIWWACIKSTKHIFLKLPHYNNDDSSHCVCFTMFQLTMTLLRKRDKVRLFIILLWMSIEGESS